MRQNMASKLTKEPLGDCYEVHTKAILEGHDGVLCHGTVYHPSVGWHGHCWIEEGDGDIVIDYSNGHCAALRKERYYEAGRVKDVKKYNTEEVRELTLQEGTYGPWNEKEKEELLD